MDRLPQSSTDSFTSCIKDKVNIHWSNEINFTEKRAYVSDNASFHIASNIAQRDQVNDQLIQSSSIQSLSIFSDVILQNFDDEDSILKSEDDSSLAIQTDKKLIPCFKTPQRTNSDVVQNLNCTPQQDLEIVKKKRVRRRKKNKMKNIDIASLHTSQQTLRAQSNFVFKVIHDMRHPTEALTYGIE